MSTTISHYTSLVDSETYAMVDDDAIIELNAHLGVPIPHGQYTHPEIGPEDLQIIADELRTIDATELAARVEIEKRLLEENNAHTFRFVATELADLVVLLAILKTKVSYAGEMESLVSISRFGRIITQSTEDLVAESLIYKEIPDLRPMNDDRRFIDPFEVVASTQQLEFVDQDGNPIDKDDLLSD